MADKVYSSIIDAMLDNREPDWKALNLSDEKKSGEDVLDRTHQYVDKEFIDEIAESASHHTPVPPSKSATLQNRIEEKEAAAPRVNAVKADWRKDARRDQDAYKSEHGDNDSLMSELTMSLDTAESEGKVEKKDWSDGQIQSYIKGLLNQGTSPAKVAQQLSKLAEIELFNHQSATDYLQRNAGMLGLAYLEPNTYMDKQNPNYRHTAGVKESKVFDTSTVEGLEAAEKYKEQLENKYDKVNTTPVGLDRVRIEGVSKERTASSNDCVSQQKAWQTAGIKPQARSVKQISACRSCSFFKKDASGKRCNLYHLPVVASAEELSQIVNHLTPGVPNKRKHAALVEIANRNDQQRQPFDAKTAKGFGRLDDKVANQANRIARQQFKFYAEHVAKLHAKGVSLQAAYQWAGKKFDSVEVSVAFRGFVQSLRKNASGKFVVANSDLKFLNSIGIRNEAFESAAKCASCPTHFEHVAKEENERGVLRVDGKFAQRTASVVRESQSATPTIVLTAGKIRLLHQRGHSLEKIYKGAASKVGSVEARKHMAEYIKSLKKTPGRIAISAADHSFLEGKLSFQAQDLRTLDTVRRPTNVVVASSNGTVLGYPGMEKQASERQAHDGHSILNEYDLNESHDQDIDIREPERLNVEQNSSTKINLE